MCRMSAFVCVFRAIVMCTSVFWAVHANADVLFTYNGFASTAGLTMIGSAGTAVTSDGSVLRVTPALADQTGAAYSTVPVQLGPDDTFTSLFDFRFTDAGGINPADGLTFVVAADPSGLGRSGSGMGYWGASVHSIAVEFDTFNNGPQDGNSSNHVALNTEGLLTNTGLTNVYGLQTCDFGSSTIHTRPGCMSNGDLWSVNVSYNGTALNVMLKDPAKGTSFTAINNLPVDIASILGQGQAFVGFTAGTGDGFENHDITFWEMSSTVIPEPSSFLLLGVAILVLLCFARRRSQVSQ